MADGVGVQVDGADASARLLEARLRAELSRHAAVELLGPSGSGKLTLASRIAASVDVLDGSREDAAATTLRTGADGDAAATTMRVGTEADGDAGATTVRAGTDEDAAATTLRAGVDFAAGARLDPSLLLHGASPHLVADCEALPSAWGALGSYARAMEEAGERGTLLLTASCEVAVMSRAARTSRRVRRAGEGVDDGVTRLRLLPLSLQELGVSTGEVSLAGLWDGELRRSSLCGLASAAIDARRVVQGGRSGGIAGVSALTSADIAELVCRGGWPACVGRADEEAAQYARHQAERLVARAAECYHLGEDSARGCLWALARCAGEVPTYERVAAGMEAMGGSRPARDTVRRYLRDLAAAQVVLPVEGWTPPGRARARVRTKAVYPFADPSVAAVLLGLGPERLGADPVRLQALLAGLVVRDLHIYVEALGGGRVCHYRDETGLAADGIVERRDAAGLRWGALRVALSEATVEDAAHDLRLIARKNSEVEASFLAVVVGQGVAGVRQEDGVWVVPLTALGA